MITNTLLRLLLSDRKEDYFWTSLENFYIFVSRNLDIKPENFLDLKIGDKVYQIGETGGSAAVNRQADFYPYITYAGIRYEKMTNDGKTNRVLMFEVLSEDKPEGVDQKDTVHVALRVISEDLGTPELAHWNNRYNTPTIYQPKFFLFDSLTEEEKRAKFEAFKEGQPKQKTKNK